MLRFNTIEMGLDEKGKERLRSVQVENGKLNNINKV
jgi:hypothetical protein